ncbi:MAG: YdeI/OmpD-associated family protein [Burkholderiales bacterium]|nr:YdeI/OmpD-associated family protein [Burkholderiales bacterium]
MSAPKFFPESKAFRTWLESNAATAPELLVGFHKVGSGKPSMTWSESVDEALCFGWIDGVTKRIDDASYTVRFTPRKPTSIWSKVNIAKYHKLEAEGRMTPAGAKAFALRSETKSGVYSFEQPGMPELSAAELRVFKRNKAAWKFFEATPPGYRKTVLHWVTTAKREETRASRLARLIEACAAGERLR